MENGRTSESKLRVGVLGLGRMGRLHLDSLRGVQTARVTLACDASTAVCEDARRSGLLDWAAGQITDDWRRVVASADTDAIVICTPPHAHVEQIEACVDARKPVFCEKPVSLDLADTRRAWQAVRAADHYCQIGFHMHFDANVAAALAAVKSGALGEIQTVRQVARAGAAPPEFLPVSGGIHMDKAIHNFELARHLAGARVSRVYASGHCSSQAEHVASLGDVETSLTMLQFDNGASGTVEVSRASRFGFDDRIEIFGTDGCASVDNRPQDLCSYRLATSKNQQSKGYVSTFMERYRDAYRCEMEAFVGRVNSALPPPLTVEDGLIAATVADAARRSLKDCLPVEVVYDW